MRTCRVWRCSLRCLVNPGNVRLMFTARRTVSAGSGWSARNLPKLIGLEGIKKSEIISQLHVNPVKQFDFYS